LRGDERLSAKIEAEKARIGRGQHAVGIDRMASSDDLIKTEAISVRNQRSSGGDVRATLLEVVGHGVLVASFVAVDDRRRALRSVDHSGGERGDKSVVIAVPELGVGLGLALFVQRIGEQPRGHHREAGRLLLEDLHEAGAAFKELVVVLSKRWLVCRKRLSVVSPQKSVVVGLQIEEHTLHSVLLDHLGDLAHARFGFCPRGIVEPVPLVLRRRCPDQGETIFQSIGTNERQFISLARLGVGVDTWREERLE
jgi:hypothetical protein